MGSPTVQQQWMRAIRDDRTLKAGGKAVLLILATHMDADGTNCRPGVNLLATESGMGRDAAFDNLEKAKQAGLVQVLQRRGASIYVPCVGGVPLTDPANRRQNPNSEQSVTVGDSSTVDRPVTVGETSTVGSSLSTIPPANRRQFVDTTRADQGQLASSVEPQPKDKADHALIRHGIPLSERPSLERFLRVRRKATSPGGLIVVLGDSGQLRDAAAESREWAKATPVPPRVNGSGPAPCPLECRNGWLEDPANDNRPYPCSHCQPDHKNGRPA